MRATPTISGAKHVPQLSVRGDEMMGGAGQRLCPPGSGFGLLLSQVLVLIETLDYLGSVMRAHKIS